MDVTVVPKIENVYMVNKYVLNKSCAGSLFVTTTHLIFKNYDKKQTWIPLLHISTIEKLPLTTSGSPLLIRCKNFLSATFILPRERDCHVVYTILLQHSQPTNIESLYCFRFTSSNEDIPKSAGWTFFDLESEYQRMGVPNDQWCLTLLNKDYEVCDTYPKYLYVPSSAPPSVLLGSSKFRSKGRLPVLTYLHKNKATICRCSQPLSGFNARNLEDEQMLNYIWKANPSSSYMYVVDTRPKINAFANKAAGKGYESEQFYENIKFHFLGIENIHVMRSSLLKLIETCELKTPSMSSFISGLESSGWLKHIKSILDTTALIANAVESGISVVVHCSDGWDRTAQVCSLAAILLDPYYRTIQGFQALIEKDWLSFGHKFTDRVGHLAGDPKEVSPIFTQMIDCVWQLMHQFPTAFQFNERFLIILHDNMSSCEYGTFVGNSEKERRDLRLHERTYSLWGYMANHMKEYMNPLFADDVHASTLSPTLFPQAIRFWRSMYCRFEGGVHPRETLSDLLLALTDHATSLNEHVKFLQKRIVHLKSLRSKAGSKPHERRLEKKKQAFDSDQEMGCRVVKEDPLRGFHSKDSHNSSHNSRESKPDRVTNDIELMALDWKSLRNVKECRCSTPFDSSSRKHHCWQCGNVFCTRCIEKHIALPGHASQCAVPVCYSCYQKIKNLSFESS